MDSVPKECNEPISNVSECTYSNPVISEIFIDIIVLVPQESEVVPMFKRYLANVCCNSDPFGRNLKSTTNRLLIRFSSINSVLFNGRHWYGKKNRNNVTPQKRV